MTALIGGAILLAAGATIALLFGWGGGDNATLLLSLVASVVAGVLIAIAYVVSRREAKRGPTPEPTDEATPEAEPTSDEAEAEATPPEETEGTTKVVAYKARGRFHKPTCRYADRPGGEEMERSAAEELNLQPCGICKP